MTPLTIGVLSSEVANGYSEPILSELADAAREIGARLVSFVEWLHPDDIHETKPLTANLVGAPRLDAVLVLPLGATLSAQALAAYCERFRPLPVCCIPDVAAAWCSRTHVDNEPGMRAVVTHLVEAHGCRRIGFVRGPAQSDEAELRYRVYREVLAAHGLPFDPELVAPGHYIVQSGVDAVRLFLDERKLELDAIACANDGTAFGVIEALTSRDIDVPGRIAVVGFDDVDLARYHEPPLTTARQPLRELGRTALDVLLSQLEPFAQPRCEVLSSRLVVRESCGCLGASEARQGAARASLPARTDGLPAFQQRLERVALSLGTLGIPGAPNDAWEARILRAFSRDLSDPRGEFLREFRALLQRAARVRGDVGGFHKVITLIRHHVEECFVPPERKRAEDLLHAARVLVSSVAERTQSSQQVRFEDFTYKLTRTAGELGNALDLNGISAALRAHLPQYGISACYVCLYDPPEGRPEHALLVAGFGPAIPEVIPSLSEAPRFLSRSVLPDAAFSVEGPAQYIVGPLSRSGQVPGYAVFARGPVEGFVYQTLLDQLGSAVARVELLQRLLREAALRETAERERMERELAIAERIQTGVLPATFAVQGLDIAAVMQPATEVGGDYYDLFPAPGGCWLGIGDVAGHGLPTGLVMLMLQSAVSGLVHTSMQATPREILLSVNAVLYENIRERMGQDEHVTLTLLRCDADGEVTFAGAHEPILLYRARERRHEWVETPGTWVGAIRDIAHVTVDSSFRLESGDVMLLYTDGVTEARNAQGETFGPERLAEHLCRAATLPAAEIRDALLSELKAWIYRQDDDFSLFVAKREAP